MRHHVARRAVLAGLAGLMAAPAARAGPDDVPVVAAASDLQFALPHLAEAFREQTGLRVRPTFGSTGNFARQIREGAPFQVFMAADEQFVLDLARDGLTESEGALYAVGRIVLIVPQGSHLAVDGSLQDLAMALEQGRLDRFAIANPDHAPYGRRAMEALQTRGLWDAIQPHLVLGENVSQAAQFALSGNADGGIIAYSLALAPDIAARGRFALIPQEWHAPLRQRMALVSGAGQVARDFYRFVTTPAAREILTRHGFVLPEAG